MKAIVIYKTTTGSTQKYAEIVAKNTGANVLPLGKTGGKQLYGFDTIVFGGSVHMGSIGGLAKFRKLARKHPNARTAIFAVGSAAPDNKKVIDDLVKKNFPEGFGSAKFFYLQGGMDLGKMKFPFRQMMKWVKKMVEMNPDKKPDDIEFLKMFESRDVVNEKNAIEIIRFVGN